MKIYPAIDLYDGKAVRLFKGNYDEMTVYSDKPEDVARDFCKSGATHVHLVDLEGARSGATPNLEVVERIAKACPDAFIEVGGGVRSMDVIARYLSAGVSRVILGTAAVTDPDFLRNAIAKFGDKVAVGVDLKDGLVAIKGWTEKSKLDGFKFVKELEVLGVSTIICTDVSRDGAMKGANHGLYARLARETGVNIIASGGVSSIEDVRALRALDIHGAIIGKAYYTGAISLSEAIEVAK